MEEIPTSPAARRRRGIAWGAGLLAIGAIGGALFAVAVPAGANTTTATAAPAASAGPQGEGHGKGGQRPGETLLTGADAEKAKAAALKAVPGATIDRVETDADGAVYEAHVTKSDGTKVTVKFDKDFNVTGVESGMGGGVPPAPAN